MGVRTCDGTRSLTPTHEDAEDWERERAWNALPDTH